MWFQPAGELTGSVAERLYSTIDLDAGEPKVTQSY